MKATFPLFLTKKLAILLLFLGFGTYVSAQTMDTVRIVGKAKKFAPGKNILLMFELVDTVDASGQKTAMSRSYYFDERNRKISSVREYYNPKRPLKGTQVIYSFGANKLTAVTVTPPKSTCRNCTSRYYYSNDSLSSKQEDGLSKGDPEIFKKQAHAFQAKVPQDLPWGAFDNEVIVNGNRKRIKSRY